MQHALLAYASTHGQTAKIATRIAEHLRTAGLDVTLHRMGDGEPPDAGGFDLVVVGASVHAGHHQRVIADWVKSSLPALGSRPSAFFSVSLTAAEDSEEARATSAELIAELTRETGWQPPLTVALAGALQYAEYDVFTRLLMRVIARSHGQPTDPHEDLEYTDWDAVESFAARCADQVSGTLAAT